MKKKGAVGHAAPLQEDFNFKDPSEVIYRMKRNTSIEKLKTGKVSFDSDTPRAPSGLERIQDAMRRDTAAPLFWSLAINDPFRPLAAASLSLPLRSFDLVGSCQILADLVRILFVACRFQKKYLQSLVQEGCHKAPPSPPPPKKERKRERR